MYGGVISLERFHECFLCGFDGFTQVCCVVSTAQGLPMVHIIGQFSRSGSLVWSPVLVRHPCKADP